MRFWHRWISPLLFAFVLASVVTMAATNEEGWPTHLVLFGLMFWFIIDRYLAYWLGIADERIRMKSEVDELFNHDPALKSSVDQAIASHRRRHEHDQSGHEEYDDLARWRR